MRLRAIPTGLHLTAQGCCTRLPWDRYCARPNPGGVAPGNSNDEQPNVAVLCSGHRSHNPLGVAINNRLCVGAAIPRVAEYGNPGLRDSTPLGLQTHA